jgi:hypothetical protein
MQFQPLKIASDLIVHHDGTISIRNLVGRKWKRLRHHLIEITERDFKRLSQLERARNRRQEKRRGIKVVVGDHDNGEPCVVG